MNGSKLSWVLPLALTIILSLACGPGSILRFVPGMQPTPSTSNIQSGSSPMSGDWNAQTDFGHLAFTVDPEGQKVTTAVAKIDNFHCGDTSLTTESQVLNSWSIDGGEFSGQVDLGETDEILYVAFNGTYDAASKTFSGTWDFDAHGTDCTGEWTTSPHQ
jgi:hypothetical protein